MSLFMAVVVVICSHGNRIKDYSEFLAYFPYFEKKRKVGLCDLHAVCVSHPNSFRMPEPIFMKLGMYIMAPGSIPAAYFISPVHQSVCLYVYPPIVARLRLGKDVPAATKNCWRRHFLSRPCRIKGKYAISSSQNFLLAYFSYFVSFIL
jgi:hypothetical protein